MCGRRLLGIGFVGTAVAAACCFTPLLVVVLPAIGLGAWLAWIDVVLLPLLFLFVGVTLYAALRLRRREPIDSAEGVSR